MYICKLCKYDKIINISEFAEHIIACHKDNKIAVDKAKKYLNRPKRKYTRKEFHTEMTKLDTFSKSN